MASTDNGKQVITFRYQQEGTAEGFNKLLNGVIPTGVITGGELSRVGETNTVNIAKMQMMISDGNVTVHVETTEVATVILESSKPYVVATFNWINLTNNFVTFESSALNSLPSNQNAIILGKGEFSGSNLTGRFDYTRKTWSSTYYNNDFLFNNSYKTKSPSFNVTPIEGSDSTPYEIGFYVGTGKGIIGGKEVEILNDEKISLSDADTDYLYINRTVQYGRVDIAVLMKDKSVRYIMGKDENVLEPQPPIFPSNGLVLAKFTYSAGTINYILGSNITNVYNNNYLGLGATIGEQKAGNTINGHTLYL